MSLLVEEDAMEDDILKAFPYISSQKAPQFYGFQTFF